MEQKAHDVKKKENANLLTQLKKATNALQQQETLTEQTTQTAKNQINLLEKELKVVHERVRELQSIASDHCVCETVVSDLRKRVAIEETNNSDLQKSIRNLTDKVADVTQQVFLFFFE
jgi:predicted  nucleic acid-binding Zn-ribbon protein